MTRSADGGREHGSGGSRRAGGIAHREVATATHRPRTGRWGQLLIRWRFGLDNEDELTLKEIGDKYNLSRERIRQLQEQAIGKIRKQMREF